MYLKGSGMGFEIESSYIQNLLQLLNIWRPLDKVRDFFNIAMGVAYDNL